MLERIHGFLRPELIGRAIENNRVTELLYNVSEVVV